MKKIIALLLTVVLTATIAVSGTLAYLTADAGTKTNTFQVGSIGVELVEEVGVETSGGGSAAPTDTGAAYSGLMPGDKIIKKVTVRNPGSMDAYVRVTVKLNNALAINKAIDEFYGDEAAQKKYDEIFAGWGLNHSKDLDGDGTNDAGMRLTITGSDMPEHVLQVDSVKTIDEYAQFYTGNWFGEQEDIIPFDGYYTGDMKPYEIKYTYYILLPAAKETTLFNGLNIPAEFNADQLAMFDGLRIDIDADAIQAANLTPRAAFAALSGKTATASTADELVAALEAGESVVLTQNIKIDPASMSNAYGTTGLNQTNGGTIDGAGNTIDIRGAGGTWDSGINTTGGTIKNLTVTGSFRGIFINHNSTHSEPVILDNVTIEGTTYTISCDQGMNQGLTATDSTFKGWTSYAATLGNAKFIGCTFGKGNGYAFMRPYAPTEFVDCEFEAGYVMDARAMVSFENCTLGGVDITADNLAMLVTSNITNASVK